MVRRLSYGKSEVLLATGSAAGVELRPDPATGKPQVWVGIENWDDPDWNYASGKRLWNVVLEANLNGHQVESDFALVASVRATF